MGAVPAAVRIEIARLPAADGLPLPSRATSSSAGYDLCAAVEREVVVPPGNRVLVPTLQGLSTLQMLSEGLPECER